MTEKKQRFFGILLIALAAALAVIGYLILPDSLVVQMTMDGTAGNTLPKLLGLLIPLAVSVIFAIVYMKQPGPERIKYLLLSLLGVAIWVFLVAVNGTI